MQLAINKAWEYQLLTYPNPAVGATVTFNNNLISLNAHKKAGESHAEVNAIKDAFLYFNPKSELINLTSSHDIHNFLIKNHNNIFNKCTIYVTLEPCNHIGKTPSCASLIKELNFKRVVIGTLDPNKNATGGIKTLKDANIEISKSNLEKETNNLLIPFTKWQKDKFIFFKLAMREDGSIDGGYITTKESLKHVHKLRTLIDTLVIGGNTVRTDRPTLDTRFIDSKINPDILIYSKNQNIDKTIPLFNIANRKVEISDSLNLINSKNFIMIEGGYNLLEILKDKIDLLIIFVSKEKKSNKKFDLNIFDFQKIHTNNSAEDQIVWLKR
jgi:diaminohydroxyphosphoribosylaminopyrimidine deaminase / 5-amino-6-(5-phosphoribosylamino)uracil reductase